MVIGLPPEGLGAAWERDFASYPPAGVIVFRRDFQDLEGLRRLTARLRELARPRRIFIGIDEEGGHVSQLRGHLVIPPNALLLGRGADLDEIEWVSRVTAERLRALGVDWVFAPVADIHSEPLNPVIGPRAYGAHPHEVTRRVAAAVRGFQSGGAACCVKHFPGHGDTAVDSHLALPVCRAPRELLERRELAPFRGVLEADSLMTAHVVYPVLDPDRPGTFSRAIAHDLLRGALRFRGVSITDALEMKGAAEGRDASETGRLALAAGCDLLLYAFHDEAVRRARLELAKDLVDGRIEREAFDAARPRLARMDETRPEPTAEELARPIESLTPPDWEARLERIVERGLVVRRGDPIAASTFSVSETDYADGGALAGDLASAGLMVAEEGAEGAIVVYASRLPMPAERIEELRRAAATRPTLLVGLQNDGFLDEIPEAALRLSAGDATPLTRRVVARRLARELGAGAART